ncbi:MAG: hypothetical protein HGB06_12365 [Chlorobaculum sp.]|jgi:hypothetical protein|nr:hypothetical protein [Chlorobaculum sp.]
MKITRISGQKWLTAFILSPGMIFAMTYSVIWLSTNLWLNHSFKRHLKQIFIAETGQQYRIDIGSLRSGADLNSLMLKKLQLTPVGGADNTAPNHAAMQIAELRIDCPNLSFIPFRPADEALSLRMVSRQILSSSVQ